MTRQTAAQRYHNSIGQGGRKMQATYYDYLRWLEQQNQPVQQNNVPIIAQVANRTAAELFNVLPNQRAILVDSDAPYVYVKQRAADNRLLPLEVYDLVPHVEKVEPTVSMDGYVKREDIDRIVAEEVEKKFAEAFAKPNKKEETE